MRAHPRIVALVAALAAAAPPLLAQRPDMGKTPITATAVRDSSGGTLVIRNPTQQTVIALAFIYTMRSADASVLYAANGYYDSLIDPLTQQAIKPGQEVRIPYRIPYSDANPVVGVDAVLFADGTTFGERNVVQTLYDRRNYTLVSLNKSIADLKDALKNGTPRQQLISDFQRSMVIETSNAADQDLASCIQLVRSQVISALVSARRPDGAPIPTQELIQSEIDLLNARREALRAAIVPK